MTRVLHRDLFLDGPAGRLEALLWTSPLREPPLAGLVCHPHPLFGGNLHNKVVFRAAKTMHRLGVPVLRFNFRGAGKSDGRHDEGRGEAEDIRAALDFLAAEFPRRPVLLAGFSFGAWVGLRVGCADARVAGLIGLGVPVNNAKHSYLRDCRKPKLFVHGSEDEHGAIARVRELFASLPEPKRLAVVEGADHFFAGKLAEVETAIRAWLLERHPELSSLEEK